jgi:benzil reductase ((S)-benzoin forming)
MNYFFVTGSSRGLGKAIVEDLLKNSNNKVFGLSRQNSISHYQFSFIKIDLSDSNRLNLFQFPELNSVNQLVLINNAGTIGQIKPTGKKDSEEIIKTYLLNTIAPSILSNQFIKQYQNLDSQKIILNISSGAGRHTINSWAEYCASKAALDMYSKVLAEEQQKQKYPFKLFSVAPGIIDTDMQSDIRSAKKEDFEQLEFFRHLKTTNSLSQPKEIAKAIRSIINSPERYKDVLLDVRDL